MVVDDPYRVLGLKHDASESQIKKAYHKAALKYHPDRQNNKEKEKEVADKFAEISEAYDTLTDPVKRYDWRQKHEESSPPPPPPPPPPPTSTTPSQRESRSPRRESRSPRACVRKTGLSSSYRTANMSHTTHTTATTTVTNSSKRADFMARKHQAQEESRRSLTAAPVREARRPNSKRQSLARSPPPPSPRGNMGRSPTRRSMSSSPYHLRRKVHGMAVNMDGSIRKSGVDSPDKLSPKASLSKLRVDVHRMPKAPMSPGANTARKRMSTAQPRRSMSAPRTPSGYRMPDISLPVQKTAKGNVIRTSIRINPKSRSQSPKRPSLASGLNNNKSTGQIKPKRPSLGAGTSTRSLNFEPNSSNGGGFQRTSDAPLRRGKKPQLKRNNSLEGTCRKKPSRNQSTPQPKKRSNSPKPRSSMFHKTKKEPEEEQPKRRNSLKPRSSVFHKTKEEEPKRRNSLKPRSSVFHRTKEPEEPTSPKNRNSSLKPRSSKFFQKIKEREDAPSSSASQPPTAARKSFFGFSMRNKVQSAGDDLKPKKKKKTNKKKSKSVELKQKNKKTKKQKSHRSLAVPQ